MRRFLSVALLFACVATPAAVLAHEGHEHGVRQSTKAPKKAKTPAKKRSDMKDLRGPVRATPFEDGWPTVRS